MPLVQSLFLSVIDLARYCAGFHAKTARVDEFEWSYMEREATLTDGRTVTEPVVFVHGFSSWKESWTNLARRVDKKYQVIVPDLPGQGRTTPAEPTLSYAADDQAERLHRFLEETIPADQKVHLVGCSMGGMLAGIYSAKYPERVRSLTMICPAGITMPIKSDAFKLLDEGKNLLLAKTPEEMAEMSTFIGHKPVTPPRFLLSMVANYRMEKMPVYEKIFEDTKNQPTVLEDQLEHIRAKSLIFWGKNDRILDVSSLPILTQKLVNVPQQFSFVFDECGHTVQHEKYEECAKAINLFLDGETPRV